MEPTIDKNCFGFCYHCQTIHQLPQGEAYQVALKLIEQLDKEKNIDFVNHQDKFSTDYLFSTARGQMFGILECRNQIGQQIFLKAFSCQYNSEWTLEGWAPPLFDVTTYLETVKPIDKKIKELGTIIAQSTDKNEIKCIKQERKKLSQNLMLQLHGLYRLHNRSGQQASLNDAFTAEKGIPTGTGDCCAPKLLNWANKLQYTPVSLAEFYYGKENRSKTRQHKTFYSACENKCQPILGFLLCEKRYCDNKTQ